MAGNDRLAAGQGFQVLQSRRAESEARLAYSGISDLVGGVFDELRAGLPPPQERALGSALLISEAELPVDFRATATAFVNALSQLAVAAPVVVAVDDVQWFDPASERVLAFAARRLPAGVGLLLTLRRDAGAPSVGSTASLADLKSFQSADVIEIVAPTGSVVATIHGTEEGARLDG